MRIGYEKIKLSQFLLRFCRYARKFSVCLGLLMFKTRFRWFCLSLLVLSGGCAQKNLSGAGGQVPAQRSIAGKANGAESATKGGGIAVEAAEQPAFALSSVPMRLRCADPQGLEFIKSAGLNPVNSYLLARFAMVGGAPFPFNAELKNYFKSAGFSQFTALENSAKGVQGFVASSSQMNLVVFRGTHDLKGAISDLQFALSPSSFTSLPGGVHSGFKSSFDSISSALYQALNLKDRPDIPTYFVGHSLGAALATLAAVDGVSKGVRLAGVVSLGQPRIGNSTFSLAAERVLADKFRRYVYGNDPVPHVPPAVGSAQQVAQALIPDQLLQATLAGALQLFRFSHVGVPVSLGQANSSETAFTSDDAWDSRYWLSNVDSVKQSVLNVATPQNTLIADHGVENYLCEMLKAIR